uniref:Uncharacterized protein n=1 Tax=Oryza punctata TaxID=4537 RepID=A0A0E0LJB6_ORYPU
MIVMHCLKPTQQLRCVAPKKTQKWDPLPSGLICANVDAAFFAGTTTSEIAEALALPSATALAQEEGFHNLAPSELHDEELHLVAVKEPTSFKEAELELAWRDAMREVTSSIKRNKTWHLTTLHVSHRAIGLK